MPDLHSAVPINQIVQGDALEVLTRLPDACVDMCVTSPPYWGLRSYGTRPRIWDGDPDCVHEWVTEPKIVETTQKGSHWQQANNGQGMAQGKLWTRFRGDVTAAEAERTFEQAASAKCAKCDAWRGELGLEPTPTLYVEHLRAVFREIRRVLRADGTLWLNLGDCYSTQAGRVGHRPGGGPRGDRWCAIAPRTAPNRFPISGLKPKDLVGLPWRVAFALRDDGWYLRSEVIWQKPNPMPESVRDRPTRAHENVFLFSKSRRYHYDAAAIAEPLASGPSDMKKMAQGLDRIGGKHRLIDDPLIAASSLTNIGRKRAVGPRFRSGNLRRDIPTVDDGRGIPNDHRGRGVPWEDRGGRRNARSVWTIATQPFRGAHFATFPVELVKRCIAAGSKPLGIVLDPFIGSGTTAEAALRLGREFLGIELNPSYVEMARRRISSVLSDQNDLQKAA